MKPLARKRLWAMMTSVVLALTGVVGLQVNQQAAHALDGSKFDPGLIIGDSVYYDFGAMNVDQVQTFLENKVPKCKIAATDPFTCLRYFHMDVPARDAVDGRCSAIEAATNQSAAQIIVTVGRACNINPRVLLVTLQKEQGFISNTSPSEAQYRKAMGYGCPDTSVCSSKYYGFFNQIYSAASQFHWYGNPAGSFTFLKVGRNVSVDYQANKKSCGARTFLLKSQATAALYYYTPYTPNEAALANLYGTGDSCSAYGNRNFWRYYWDWFGSPIGGGFLLKSATSDVFLIVDDPATNTYEKHRVSDTDLITALAPLGPIGTVSQEYLDSFPAASDMTRLVKTATGTYWFVDGGKKYLVSSCDQAADFGLSCLSAVQLTANQLAALPSSGTLTGYVPDTAGATTGPQYLISGGLKHEILDPASVTDAGITLPPQAPVAISAFSYLPWGAPIAKPGQVFTNRTTGTSATIIDGKYYEITAATAAEIDFKQWFVPSSGTLSTGGVSTIQSGVSVQPIVSNSAGKTFVITSTGRIPVDPNSALVAKPVQLPDGFIDKIPLLNQTLTSPFLAKGVSGKNVYYIDGGFKRATFNAAAAKALAKGASVPETQILPTAALAQIASGPKIFAPASVVQNPTGALLLIDGTAGYRVLTGSAQATLFGLAKPVKALKTDLTGYKKLGGAGTFRVLCGTQQYFAVSGTWLPINDLYAAEYPGKSVALDQLTCANLKLGNAQLGRFVVSPAKLTYLLSKGKRRLVANAKQYVALRGTTPAAVKIDATLNAMLPLGTALDAKTVTPIPNAEDAGGVTPSPTPTGTPTPKPTVTPTPKPTGSPTPTPTPAAKTYVVVSGDTLSKIATKFGVTVAAIKTANNLTSDLISIGQKLIIP